MESSTTGGSSKLLLIRREQMQEFRRIASQRFDERVRIHLRDDWMEECAEKTDAELLDMIAEARVRAESYGIIMESDVVGFIELWLLLGRDFERSPDYPWAARILSDEGRQGSLKVSQLWYGAELTLAEGSDIEDAGSGGISAVPLEEGVE